MNHTTATALTVRDTEPSRTQQARVTYWTRRHQVDHLEARIGLTNTGAAWLWRVKRIGKPA